MALLTQSEEDHDPAEITSRRNICYVPTYKKIRPDAANATSGRIFMAIFVIT
jgi:hypothetical protein